MQKKKLNSIDKKKCTVKAKINKTEQVECGDVCADLTKNVLILELVHWTARI